MSFKHFATLCAATLLTACAPYEGRYAPDCTAYAGSIVSLQGSAFVWERFTDQVRVDDDGNIIEAYPDYPKRGTFRKEGSALHMETDAGAPLATMYLHKDGAAYRLLTDREHAAWERSGEFADCALTLNADDA